MGQGSKRNDHGIKAWQGVRPLRQLHPRQLERVDELGTVYGVPVADPHPRGHPRPRVLRAPRRPRRRAALPCRSGSSRGTVAGELALLEQGGPQRDPRAAPRPRRGSWCSTRPSSGSCSTRPRAWPTRCSRPRVAMSAAVEVRIAATDAEREAVFRFRYEVYVEELGRYRGLADHEHRRLVDAEDDHSWIVYAHARRRGRRHGPHHLGRARLLRAAGGAVSARAVPGPRSRPSG